MSECGDEIGFRAEPFLLTLCLGIGMIGGSGTDPLGSNPAWLHLPPWLCDLEAGYPSVHQFPELLKMRDAGRPTF